MARVKDKETYNLPSLEDTSILGKKLSSMLQANDIVAFYGDVGAGKTTLIKSIVSSLGYEEKEVTSPTFTYLNIYEANIPIYHFDLYRMENENDFYQKGFEEFFTADGICLIEWAEKIPNIIPKDSKKIFLSLNQDKGRLCHLENIS